MSNDFLHILRERGFVHQCTDEAGLAELLKAAKKPVPAYIGFDCTAPSLHVGSLMQIMTLRWYQKCGGKPLVLMGGATSRVGDPSFKDSARPALSDDEIAINMSGIANIFGNYLQFDDAADSAMMVNNADWMDKVGYLELLRDYGRHFSVNRMLSMDSVKLRIERAESELSFLEFNYMIMQAYDFVYLNKHFGCRLQFGGSDQWGNIVGGVELHRRLMAERNKGRQNIYEPIFGLTTPLITTASGAKMGKTSHGAVWLNADMLSPYDFWQFWRNSEDADVGRFLKCFTELPIDEIKKLENLQGAEINEAKKVLAFEATALCHGKEEAERASVTARKTFEEGGTAENLPEARVAAAELQAGIPAYKLFHLAELAASGGEARKLIRGNGARINDAPVADENSLITYDNLTEQGFIKLSAGKKRHVLVKVKR